MAATKGDIACQSGQTALAARLLGRFATTTAADGKNLIFSPLSIHVALALMSAGASGDTLAEILDFAGAPSRDELTSFVRSNVIDRVLVDRSDAGGPIVAFACGAWTDKSCPLKPAYRDTIVGKFKGTASTVDFVHKPVESRTQINAWVAMVTKGLITELVDPDKQSTDTRNVVVNAIYFKSAWCEPFDKKDTIDDEFHLLDGTSITTPFMRSWSYQQIACHDGFKVLKLPYKVIDPNSAGFNWKQLQSIPRFSMCIFLPDARDGLQSLVEELTLKPNFLRNRLPMQYVPVGVFRLPRFKLSFGGSIVHDLKSLGLVLPFEPSLTGVTEVTEEEELVVGNVIHKAVVDVNEEGSEAAAATEVDDEMGFSLYDDYVPPKPVDFIADHPFAFFILEETSGTIVFSGQILNPSKE